MKASTKMPFNSNKLNSRKKICKSKTQDFLPNKRHNYFLFFYLLSNWEYETSPKIFGISILYKSIFGISSCHLMYMYTLWDYISVVFIFRILHIVC